MVLLLAHPLATVGGSLGGRVPSKGGFHRRILGRLSSSYPSRFGWLAWWKLCWLHAYGVGGEVCKEVGKMTSKWLLGVVSFMAILEV